MAKVKKPKTVEELNKVWSNLMEMAKNDEGDCEVIADCFNEMLDELLGDDFFGTEGQMDPRGDHRE